MVSSVVEAAAAACAEAFGVVGRTEDGSGVAALADLRAIVN